MKFSRTKDNSRSTDSEKEFALRDANPVVIFFSLILTPFILFISSSDTLYLKNQVDFGYGYAVLYPFVLLFALLIITGYALYFFSSNVIVKSLLVAYYLVGPFFLLCTSIRNIPVSFLETGWGLIFTFLVFAAVFMVVIRKVSLGSMINLSALVGVLFLLIETHMVLTHFRNSQDNNTRHIATEGHNLRDNKAPNVYVLLLDEYQTDMFDSTLSDDVRDALGGFIYFPENTALYGRTEMSLASIFSGKYYDFNISPIEYRRRSFGSSSSLLYWLKEAGYSVYGYIRGSNETPPDLKLFDFIAKSEGRRMVVPTKHAFAAFRDLWIYANLPLCLSTRMLEQDRLQMIKNRTFLPQNANTASVDFFYQYLEDEKSLPASSRFTFIYLLIPHFPYIFNSDCSFSESLDTTSPMKQSNCATRLIIEFAQTLKSLARFDDSLIIICADHGSSFEPGNKQLQGVGTNDFYSPEWSMARARALLLIKPPYQSDTEEFAVSEYQSSLIDIAPTIADSVLSANPSDFDGTSLMNLPSSSAPRKKDYYFFDKKGSNAWTDEMTRFIIEGSKIREAEKIRIEDEKQPTPDNLGR